MLEKCALDYHFFYLSSTNLEVWGSQFKSTSLNPISPQQRKDFRNLNPALRKERK